jgi:hypothetical protein
VTRISWFAFFCLLATGTLLAWRGLATGPGTVATMSRVKSTSPVVASAKASPKNDKLESDLAGDTATIDPSYLPPVATANAMAFVRPKTETHASAIMSKVDRKQRRSKSKKPSSRLDRIARSQKKLQANQVRPNLEKRCTLQTGLDGVLSALNLKPKCGV